MLVKCEKCGYENFPQHRFCGMCAAALPFPVAPTARANPEPPPATRPVNRSSPAGLNREPINTKGVGFLVPEPPPIVAKPVHRPSTAPSDHHEAEPRNVSYLLEEDEPPSHRGRTFLLFILLAAILGAAWYWREDVISLASKFSRSSDSTTQPNPSVPDGSDQASTAAPSGSTNAGAPIEKPSSAASDQTAASQSQTPQSPQPNAGTGSVDASQSPQGDKSQSAQALPVESPSAAGAVKPDQSEESTQPVPITKPSQLRTRAATAPGVDELEVQGEKYLYGNGAPENCALARKSLLAAAQRSSAKAQNVLGTMYATGHCATRDLPTAYRWFGRSLRQDPGNTRIEQDLKVLWNQMTPEEQRLALRTEH